MGNHLLFCPAINGLLSCFYAYEIDSESENEAIYIYILTTSGWPQRYTDVKDKELTSIDILLRHMHSLVFCFNTPQGMLRPPILSIYSGRLSDRLQP